MQYLQRAALVLCAVLALSGVAASTAGAYGHSWYCQRTGSGDRCWDYVGTTYNPWLDVSTFTPEGWANHELCAKARTAAGNTRSPRSGYSLCIYGRINHYVCLSSSTPESHAYAYWTGSSSNHDISGSAHTPATGLC